MTMPNQAPGAETISGVVEAINPKGVKIAGQWFNYSRYNDVPRPEKGQQVQMEAKGGFIRSLEIFERIASAAVGGGNLPQVDRQSTITRLAVLKAAAEFAGMRPGTTSADVLKVAEAWEQWVNR